MPRSRSEYQSGTRLGWQRRHDVDGIIVIWQTFVISSTSAVPGLVEEEAKTEDLKHGADQSGLLENLRLEGNFNKILQNATRGQITLAVPFNTIPSFLREVASLRTLRRPVRIGSTYMVNGKKRNH